MLIFPQTEQDKQIKQKKKKKVKKKSKKKKIRFSQKEHCFCKELKSGFIFKYLTGVSELNKENLIHS